MDAPQLQSYINQINEIKNIDWNNIVQGEDFEVFDVESAKLYAKALDGVEASQASLLLSTQGLTNAEIQRVLAQQQLTTEQQYTALSTAGLLKSTQSLTIAELQETLQSQLGSKAKAEETLKSMGLSVAIEGEEQQTVELTGKKIQLAIASGQLTKAQATELAMHLGIDKALDAQNNSALPQWLSNLKNTGTALKKQVTSTISWAKALPLATKALAGIGAGVGLALVAFVAYRRHLENVRLETEKSANAYQESSSSIDDYIAEYDRLQTKLKDAKGNEEETLTVKRELLDLQEKLNEKFGDEYGRINLVTDAYNDQTEALKRLKIEEANRFLNENQSGINRAERKMEKERNYNLSTSDINLNTSDGQKIQEIVEKYSDRGMSLLNSGDGTFQIHLKANATDAYDVINDFESDIRALEDEFSNKHLFDDIINFSSSALDESKSIIDKYGEIYNQAQMANLVNDKNASPIYEKALYAVEEYNKALLESEDPFNDETVSKAKANVEAVKAEAEALGEYGTIFGDVFEQADTSLLDFNEKLKNDSSLQQWAEQLRGLEVVELESMLGDGVDDAFDSLVESANEYGLGVKDVINALIRLGYVQGEVSGGSDFSNNVVDLETLNNQIDSLQDAYKGLTTAVDEYNQYGYITADTLQTLLEMDGQYLACLINENGQLAINQETYSALVKAKLADAEATAVQQAIEELGTVTTEQQIQADTTAIGVIAQKGSALATLTGQYASLANVAVSAAQAQALADAYTDASSKNQAEAERIMSNLNAKLALIQNTAKNTSGSFGALTNHLNGFSKSSGKAKSKTDELTKSLEKQKKVLEEERAQYDELFDAIDYFYQKQEDKIDSQIDGLKETNELLEKQKSNLDGIISAMDAVYEAEIKDLKAKQDALDDAVDKQKEELALEEAKRKLLEANSRKTLGIYEKGKGIVYRQDEKAISEATSEYEQANADKAKADLQDKIDLIESYRDRINEIPDAWEKAYDAQLAYDRLGSGWQDAILNPSDDMFNNLESDYVGIQNNIESNNSRIDRLEKEKESIEELRKLWEDAKNEYKYHEYEKLLSTFIGSDYEHQLLNNSSVWRRKFADEYSSICAEIEVLEERIKVASEETTKSVEDGANKVANSARVVGSSMDEMKEKYKWSQEDTATLEYATQRLDALNELIGQGKTELTDARDKVANFVDQYSKLEDSRIVTDDLRSSVEELNGVYGKSGDYLEQMASGITDRLNDSKNYTQELVQNTQTTVEQLGQINEQIDALNTSEESIKDEAETTVSDIDTTVSNLASKLYELRNSLNEIKLATDEAEATVDEELLDTSTVVDGMHTKVSEIQSAISTLVESIAPLEGALDTLMEKLNTLDEVTLSGVIGAFGGASGGSEGGSKESGSKKSSSSKEGNSSGSTGGSGLISAVKAVDEAIGSTSDPESLLGKLQLLDDKTLEQIIAQFGLSGDDSSDGGNLLSSVNAVSDAIVGGKNDDSSLVASIDRLGDGSTLGNIDNVTNSFGKLLDKIGSCISEVSSLASKIASLPPVPSIGGGGGSAKGRAKGGIISKEDAGDFDYIAKAIGEDHMVALTEGEAVIPKDTVSKNREAIQMLLSGKDLLKYEPNLPSNFDNIKSMGILPQFKSIIPDGRLLSQSHTEQTVIQINGNLSFPNIKSGNDAELLIKDLSNMANKARQRGSKR